MCSPYCVRISFRQPDVLYFPFLHQLFEFCHLLCYGEDVQKVEHERKPSQITIGTEFSKSKNRELTVSSIGTEVSTR